MAAKEDLDLDVKPSSNKKMIIIMAIVGVVLIGVSVGVTMMLVGGGEKEAPAEAPVKALTENHYLALDTMVVNFAERGPARFLQVEMQLMAHDPAVLTAVTDHMPVIRNDILVLLGSQSYESVSTRDGKEQLRAQILQKVQQILKEQAQVEGLQAVYFTNFVMQ